MTTRDCTGRVAKYGCLCLSLLGGSLGGWASYSHAQPPTPRTDENNRQLVAPLPKSMPRPEGETEAIPIDWPAVLELARASNLEIQLAGEKVNEAQAQLSLARSQWMPSLKLGTTWLRHDGAIQDIPGNVFNTSKNSFTVELAQATFEPQKVAVDVLKAKQQVYARSGALDRATRQTLHDCSMAYIDLVAAQAGAAISMEIASLIQELVERSEQLLKQGVGTKLSVQQNQLQRSKQQQELLDARQNQLAASAQLVQLLNLAPGTRLFANEENLAPVRLVDEKTPETVLVEQALDQGPGLAEVVAIISALDKQKEQLKRLVYLPSVAVDVGQGGFGGGFGSDLTNWDGRTDVGVNVYWDVLKMVGNSRVRGLFESQRRQAMLQHDQLTAKLAAGVVVALNQARQAREKVKLAEAEISLAIEAYQLSYARLKSAETLSIEVLQAIGSLGTARANYLRAVIEYNRAQIQLQYLVGYHDPSNCPNPVRRSVEEREETRPPAEAPTLEPAPEATKSPEVSPPPVDAPMPETVPAEPVPAAIPKAEPPAPSPMTNPPAKSTEPEAPTKPEEPAAPPAAAPATEGTSKELVPNPPMLRYSTPPAFNKARPASARFRDRWRS
ncbi:MAG: TolC family protein [Planctomycetota bacterium]